MTQSQKPKVQGHLLKAQRKSSTK